MMEILLGKAINIQELPELEKYDIQCNGTVYCKWWLQDGALAHQGRAVGDHLQELFPGLVLVINQRGQQVTGHYSLGFLSVGVS